MVLFQFMAIQIYYNNNFNVNIYEVIILTIVQMNKLRLKLFK